MSDVSQGPGWWQALNGKWYPPKQAGLATGAHAASPGTAQVPPMQGLPATWSPDPSPGLRQPEPPWMATAARPSPVRPTVSARQGPDFSGGVPNRPRIAHWKLLISLGVLVVALAVLSPLALRSSPAPVKTGHGNGALAGQVPNSDDSTPTSSPVPSLTSDWLSTHASPGQAVVIARSIATTLWTDRNQALVAGGPKSPRG